LLDTCGQYFSSGSSKKKLDYFLLYFQRYFLFKVSCFPSSESFPLGISNLVHETIANLRPKLEMPKDFEASCTLVLGVEEEFLNVLKEKMPTFLADLAPGEKSDGDGLGTIREGDEEEEGHEDLSQASEGNSQSQTSATRSRSASQAAMYEEGIEGDDDKEEGGDEDEREEAGDWVDQDDGGLSQEGSERVLEVEEGDEDIAIPTAPVFNPCPEDDDFLAALDKMVNDNITESKAVSRDKANFSTMTAPVASGKGKKTWEQLQEEGEGEKAANVQVVVMLRKGGKAATTKGITVSADSMLGEQFIAKEELEKNERTRMKQLTLEINERQEEEELQEAIQQLQRVSVGGQRDQHRGARGFRPPKGAPDADLIFGSGKRAPPK